MTSADPGPIYDAIALLRAEHGVASTLEDRVIRLTAPVQGSPHLAVLRALGFAADASPVGAAAHGPAGVAAAVWIAPDLSMSRWTAGSRWVASYRFPKRGKPDDYLREATGIPSDLARGNWYAAVPDDITEAFFTVGILLDEPPFPVPKPPPRSPAPEPSPAKAAARSARARPPAVPRPPRARAAAKPKPPKKAVPAMRSCASCNMQKHVSQFVEGSDLCVDCR